MAYGKSSQQNMDTKWQIARKLDRLDLGNFAAVEFFFRVAIIFGMVRGINPDDTRDYKEDPLRENEKSIEDLITDVDKRIKELLEYDTTALLMGKMHLEEARKFQSKTMSAYFEMVEIIIRCKLTDNVKAQGEDIG
jgi:hypothetical protein